MRTRPYEDKDGLRVWLSAEEQSALTNVYERGDVTDRTKRHLAFRLGLNGLRSDEIVRTENGDGPKPGVRAASVSPLEASRPADGPRHADPPVWTLTVPHGKTGARDVPISRSLAQSVLDYADGRGLDDEEELVDVSTRTIRRWVEDARERLADRAGPDSPTSWTAVGSHDLRRTWATDCYYALTLADVPAAETLTMAWGGWRQSSAGRETFRLNYLGAPPESVVAKTAAYLHNIAD
jgi:integrase